MQLWQKNMKLALLFTLLFFVSSNILIAATNGIIMNNPISYSPHFTFKKLTPNDWPIILPWFKEPHVEKWWPTPEKDELMDYFLEKIRSKNGSFKFEVRLSQRQTPRRLT